MGWGGGGGVGCVVGVLGGRGVVPGDGVPLGADGVVGSGVMVTGVDGELGGVVEATSPRPPHAVNVYVTRIMAENSTAVTQEH